MASITQFIDALPSCAFLPWSIRKAALVLNGSTLGESCRIDPRLEIAGAKLHLANNVYINKYLLIEGIGEIHIGSNVRIGPGCKLLTSKHAITDNPSARANGYQTTHNMTIQDGAWIGAGVIVLPGLTIAKGCVIAAGAVVTRSTEPNGLYVGIPARRVRDF